MVVTLNNKVINKNWKWKWKTNYLKENRIFFLKLA